MDKIMKPEDKRFFIVVSLIVAGLVLLAFIIGASGILSYIFDPEPETDLLFMLVR